VNLLDGQIVEALDGWSSMPSDHASLFFGMAVAFLAVSRVVGICLILWSVLISSLPRVVMGLHWPSDVLVGWLLGGAIAFILIRPLSKLFERSGIIPYFEARPAIGYPLLFLATYEVAEMFQTTRLFVDKLTT
jgi:undecaprenyl-diphosphatase